MLLGREAERARIDELLEAARRGRTGVLVVTGEPGIGKTALLDEACTRAAGMQVLRVAAFESDSELVFAGLHTLLRPLTDLVSRLEDPQARALGAALAIADDGAPDVLAVNAGTLSLIAEAARQQSVLIVVDDAHWLDRASADAIAFAARRLRAEQVAFVVSARSGTASAFDTGFDRIELEPLRRDLSRTLVSTRRERVPASSVDRLLDLAAGNPLALLELPGTFAPDEWADADSVTDRLWRAFAARLEPLPQSTRRALVVAAAEPDAAAVRRAGELLELGSEPLAPAEAAGLVEVAADGVRFRHPLVRSLAYAAAGSAERRRAHRALADVLPSDADRDRRAWHLAAAASEPDEQIAALLESTADAAEARGGHSAAARALERAARLSVDPEAAGRRLTRAARLTFWAGDVDRGARLAEDALASSTDPLLRADAVLELASIRHTQGAGFEEARRIAGSIDVEQLDPDRATRLLNLLVGSRLQALDVTGAVALASPLCEVARRAGPWWGPRGLATAAEASLAAGDTRRYLELFAELRDDDAVTAAFAGDVIRAELYDEARTALETTLRAGRAAGNAVRVIWNQCCLGRLDLRLGQLQRARLAATEAIEVGVARGIRFWVADAKCTLAGVQALAGEEACRTTATELLAAANESGAVLTEFAAHEALGRLELGCGRVAEAIETLLPSARRWHASSFRDPSGVAFVVDLVEAYAQAGETHEASLWLDRFRTAADRAGRTWGRAAVARCDGMLASATAFADDFERSLALLEPSPLALDRARTQLAYGERLRRTGARREARIHLREAHEGFAAAGAAPWADRAAAELRATGESVGPRERDHRSSLTPQELQIADLVGQGKTNKEIAAQLYLSPKTIEYHLANAYRKLAVHSRAELTRVVAHAAPVASRSSED